MCLGIEVVIGAALSIAQAAAGFAQAQQQADAQNAYHEENRRAAIVAMQNEYAGLQNRRVQEANATATEKFGNQIKAAKATAEASTAAGEAGVTGLSVAALLDDFKGQYGRQSEALDVNYQMARDNIAGELLASNDRAISRINSVRKATNPSPFPYLLQGLGGALQGLGKSRGTA